MEIRDCFDKIQKLSDNISSVFIGKEDVVKYALTAFFADGHLLLDDVPGVVVMSHGPFAWGTDAMNAVHNAVVMEEVAFMDWHAMVINPEKGGMQQALLDKHFLRKHGKNAYYGQNF